MENDAAIRFFGYEIPAELYQQITSTLEQVRQGDDSDRLGARVAQDLVEITHIGFEAYYQRPSDMIELSPMVRKAADTGVSAVRKGITMVIHKLMAKRSLQDLQRMARDMSHMLCISEDPAPRYFVCFPLTDELYDLTQRVIARAQVDSDVDAYRGDVIHSLEELIQAAIRNYYEKPVAQADLGRLTRAAADMGMTTVRKGSSMVVHKVFKSMPYSSLLPLVDYFKTLLHQEVSTYHQLQQANP